MQTATQFRLPDGLDQGDIDAILTKRFTFLTETPQVQSWRIYDTFDRRLFAKSLTLQWSGQDLVLRTLPDGDALHHLPLSSPPRFAWDLPESAFKAQLAGVIAVRALLELATVNAHSCTYRILNKDEKTVVRLVYTEAYLDTDNKGSVPVTFLTVRPLRGYAKQSSQLTAYMQRSLNIAPNNVGVHFWAAHTVSQTSGAYAGEPHELDPNMQAGEATRLILRHFLETMRSNEGGIKADIDSEFLHDYRIAVRRTRSALNQIRKVFPPETTDYFKQEFRTLGQLTNELRDLDVYLLAEADFAALLPDAMKEDITPIFDYLRSHRSEALAEVIAGLESESYARLLEAWDSFLHEPVGESVADNATVPVINLARKRIVRQYQRILDDGNYILKHTEDSLLHALRIECKRLRYLLEFFANLFPPKEMARLIKQLKSLQDNLGEFTDLAVQQTYLLSIAEGLDINEARARRALVATGFLVESMARRQQVVRADFAGTFKRFASPSHQRYFLQVFTKKKGRKS